jgi:hypothetical protein
MWRQNATRSTGFPEIVLQYKELLAAIRGTARAFIVGKVSSCTVYEAVL